MQISDLYHNLIPVYQIATLRASHCLLLTRISFPPATFLWGKKNKSQSTSSQPEPGPL
jgi:hypothetical protein